MSSSKIDKMGKEQVKAGITSIEWGWVKTGIEFNP
jgi:hypothetical protein